jgi:MFS family permease
VENAAPSARSLRQFRPVAQLVDRVLWAYGPLVSGTYAAALASVTRNRNLRIAQLSSLSAWTGEFLFLTAMTVYAYEQNGAAGVGVIGFLRVLPTTFALPLLGTLADHMSRRRLLVVVSLLRAITAAGAAAAAAGGIPVAAYLLVTLSTICHSAYRPVLAALLPTLCTTPAELASANAVRSILDGAASLVGPLAAAGILAVSSPAVAFVVVAALSAVAAVLVAALRYEPLPHEAASGPRPRVRIVGGMVDGLRELRSGNRASAVIVLGSVQCLVRGALLVLAVVISVRLTGMGQAGVGVLWAAFGVGGLVAAMATIGAAGSNRLGTLFGLGIGAWGLPIVVCGLVLHSWIAIIAFAVMGAANALVDVAGFTLLQRLVPDHMLARVLTVTEALFALAVAVGSLVTAPLLSAVGNASTIVATGCVLPIAVALYVVRLRAIDADIRVRGDRIELLRQVSTLRLLPIAAIEGLALHLERVRVEAGADVFLAGDPGDGFYVIESGEVTVVVNGQEVAQLGPGGSFGEIALLRSVPRTATVRAIADSEFAVVSGPRFVAAVTGFSATSAAVEQSISNYLARDRQDLGSSVSVSGAPLPDRPAN